MITVHIRKQGGAAIMTIPADILKILDIQAGSELELELSKEGFMARPVVHKHKRHTLKELLRGTTPKNLKTLKEETKWVEEGKAVGRELT